MTTLTISNILNEVETIAAQIPKPSPAADQLMALCIDVRWHLWDNLRDESQPELERPPVPASLPKSKATRPKRTIAGAKARRFIALWRRRRNAA